MSATCASHQPLWARLQPIPTKFKQMKLILLITLLSIFGFPAVYATAQHPDIVIYEGKKQGIFSNPLGNLFISDSIDRKKLFFGEDYNCTSTACYRGYQGVWIILENILYLQEIHSCCSDDKKVADLNKLFNDKYKNKRVKADWFSDTIIIPKGKLLQYYHGGYLSVYEKETELIFKKGKLTGKRVLDNSKTFIPSIYNNEKEFDSLIYSTINWRIIPLLDSTNVEVKLKFSSNKLGIIDSVWILSGSTEIFNSEAIRVIKAIPKWAIIYRHGKFVRYPDFYTIVFSNNLKRHYQK